MRKYVSQLKEEPIRWEFAANQRILGRHPGVSPFATTMLSLNCATMQQERVYQIERNHQAIDNRLIENRRGPLDVNAPVIIRKVVLRRSVQTLYAHNRAGLYLKRAIVSLPF